jgi:hypothetical protein
MSISSLFKFMIFFSFRSAQLLFFSILNCSMRLTYSLISSFKGPSNTYCFSISLSMWILRLAVIKVSFSKTMYFFIFKSLIRLSIYFIFFHLSPNCKARSSSLEPMSPKFSTVIFGMKILNSSSVRKGFWEKPSWLSLRYFASFSLLWFFLRTSGRS